MRRLQCVKVLIPGDIAIRIENLLAPIFLLLEVFSQAARLALKYAMTIHVHPLNSSTPSFNRHG